jgi:hypothetical protein
MQATLDDQGWMLDNAEDRLAHGDRLFWIPPRWQREHVEPGTHVKLIFQIAYATPEGQRTRQGERMWVAVDEQVADGWFRGRLDNDPKTTGGRLSCDDVVWFRAEHIIDLIDAEGNQASESADVVRCKEHGASETCYVCEHLAFGSGLGFHQAVDSDQRRPDAWCDACEELRLEGGGDWDTLGDRHPKLSILCGGCYDYARQRNERWDPSRPDA